MFTLPLFLGGSSKEEFDNLGDCIVTDINTLIELIEKEREIPLNGDNKEEALPPTSLEKPD